MADEPKLEAEVRVETGRARDALGRFTKAGQGAMEGFAKDAAKATKASKAFGDSFKTSATNVRAFFQNVRSGLTMIKSFAVGIGHNAEEILNLSKQFGISTDEMQRFLFVGNRTGMGAEEVGQMIARLTKKMKDNGLESMDVGNVLKQLGSELRKMKDGAEKAALAQEILGRGGAKAIPFLEGFADAFDKANAAIISEEELKQLGEFDDALDDLSKSFDKLKASAAPALGTVAEGINNILQKKGSSDSFFGGPRMDLATTLGLSMFGLNEGDEGINAARLRQQQEEDSRQLRIAQRAFARRRQFIGPTPGVEGFVGPTLEQAGLTGKDLLDRLSKPTDEAKELNKELEKVREILAKEAPRAGFAAMTDEQLKLVIEDLKEMAAQSGIVFSPEALQDYFAVLKHGREEATKAAEEQAKAEAEITAEFIKAQNEVRKENEERAKERADKLLQHQMEFTEGRTPEGAIKGFQDEMNQITNELNNLQERGAMIADDLARSFGGAFENLFLDVAEQGFRNLEESAKRFGATVLQLLARIAAQQAAMSLIGGIGSALGFGGVGYGNVFGEAKAKGGVMRGTVSETIPFRAFASGGIAREPTLALMGEGRGSKGEAFVPLPDGKSIPVEMSGGGAKNVAVSFAVTTLDPKAFNQYLVENKTTLKNLIAEAIASDNSFRRRVGTVN